MKWDISHRKTVCGNGMRVSWSQKTRVLLLIAVKLLCDLVQISSPFRGPISSYVKWWWLGKTVCEVLESIVYTYSASSALEKPRFNETGKGGQPDLWWSDDVLAVYFHLSLSFSSWLTWCKQKHSVVPSWTASWNQDLMN